MAKVNLDNLFPSLEAEQKEYQDYDFFEYQRKTLEDIGADEYYMGRPVLSDVAEVTFDNDGEEQKRHRCQLFLVDDDAEEFLQVNVNLKEAGDIQHNLHFKSSAYKLIAGIMEQIQPGWAENNNFITQTNLKEYRDYLASCESMTIFIREETGSMNYYSFKVTDLQ